VKSLKPHGLVTPQGEPLERETPRGPVNGKELVKIYIAPHANENRPITGCVNGNAFSVPYGELTTVSRAVLEVLQHAVIDTWEYPIENGRYLGVRSPDQPHMTPSLPIHRKTPRFSIMVYEQEAA
jgi:hypothetical protein